MPEFVGVDLEDSWVLGWRYDAASNRLAIELDASLWPGHAVYSAPLAGEYTCYRRATLSFEGVSTLEGLREQADVPGHLNPDGSRDFDCIDALDHVDGVFRLAGEMGNVTIHAAALDFRVAGEDAARRDDRW
jgi:hypothetical protein